MTTSINQNEIAQIISLCDIIKAFCENYQKARMKLHPIQITLRRCLLLRSACSLQKMYLIIQSASGLSRAK